MAEKKSESKKKSTVTGDVLDAAAWGLREVALPIPDTLLKLLRKKKKQGK